MSRGFWLTEAFSMTKCCKKVSGILTMADPGLLFVRQRVLVISITEKAGYLKWTSPENWQWGEHFFSILGSQYWHFSPSFFVVAKWDCKSYSIKGVDQILLENNSQAPNRKEFHSFKRNYVQVCYTLIL